MRCERARPLASAALDEALSPDEAAALDAHLRACEGCRVFAAAAEEVRQRLRLEPVGAVPDVAPRVRAALERRGRVPGRAGRDAVGGQPPGRHPRARGWRRPPAPSRPPAPQPPPAASRRPAPQRPAPRRAAALAPAAAVFAVAALIGALLGGLLAPARVVAAELPERLRATQAALTGLSARLEVTERGWHPEVPVRTYRGELRYRAPESLLLRLDDTSAYPSDGWVRNDVTLVVDGARAWARAPLPCPPAAQPGCTAPPRTRAVERREPFADAGPLPLDLVLPVRSFALGGPATDLGRRAIDGRDAVGVEVGVAQVAPLLDAVVGRGNWRGLHPADRAELWLDRSALVPLEVLVRPAASAERARWAAANGYADPAGVPVLEVRLDALEINPAGTAPLPPAPPGAAVRDGGFVDGPDGAPRPAWLPAGMRPHRTGRTAPLPGAPQVDAVSYSDGRAWVKVRATRDWRGGRLFGGLGAVVRRVALPGAGTAYVAEGGARVALHGGDVDIVVTGSLAAEDLLRVAASLGVAGRPVPAGWAEASTASLERAAAALPGLLVAGELAGFGSPGVQVRDHSVALGYAGSGARAFLLVQAPGGALGPPLDAHVLGVAVRGTAGRYTPARGELEWVEGGRVVSLRSRTLDLAELVAIAATLEPVP